MYFENLEYQVYIVELPDLGKTTRVNKISVLRAPSLKKIYYEYVDYQVYFAKRRDVGNMARVTLISDLNAPL